MRKNYLFGATAEMHVTTKIIDAKTGKVVGGNRRRRNLILDQGLNCMALKGGVTNLAGASPAGCFTNIVIGSGTNPTSVASGAITFTQTGTTVTASGGFFTAGMVGSIFKYGTGTAGAEYYITVFTNTTTVTVDTSATVAVPTVATVWNVQQTALQTLITPTGTKTYQTSAGDCGTTFSTPNAVHKRTFIIPQQAAPYTVNEIGYGSSAVTSNANVVTGRIVLSSSDVVGTSNFYLVILELTITYSPATPTAVGNVGTNINTAGNAMFENFTGLATVGSTGTVVTGSSNFALDGSNSGNLQFMTSNYTQNSAIDTNNTPTIVALNVGSPVTGAYLAASRGVLQWSYSGSTSTSGQTLYGMGIGKSTSPNNNPGFDVKFTTPQTAPTGTFQPLTVIQLTYGRILTN